MPTVSLRNIESYSVLHQEQITEAARTTRVDMELAGQRQITKYTVTLSTSLV